MGRSATAVRAPSRCRRRSRNPATSRSARSASNSEPRRSPAHGLRLGVLPDSRPRARGLRGGHDPLPPGGRRRSLSRAGVLRRADPRPRLLVGRPRQRRHEPAAPGVDHRRDRERRLAERAAPGHEVRDAQGKVVREFGSTLYGRPISATTASAMQEMMVKRHRGRDREQRVLQLRRHGSGQDGHGHERRGPAAQRLVHRVRPGRSGGRPTIAVTVIVLDGGDLGNEATGGQVAAPIAAEVIRAALER